MSDCEQLLMKGATAEYVEKRSKFIATMLPVKSEEEALREIDVIRKKYNDARHNCYAYIVYDEDGVSVIERSSDDGEPSGTAGRPMLDVISGNGIRDVLVVVTRYFGGVKLGPGGLVRAYQTAVSDALTNAELTNVKSGIRYTLNLDYTSLATVQHLMKETDAREINSTYDESVMLEVILPDENEKRFTDRLTEMFNGRQIYEPLGPVRYGESESGVFVI